MASMDRQQEFVLRTLEERDIRFVRLWFTDVSGYLKAVAVAPGRDRGGVRRGHRLRRLGDRGLRAGLRVRHARQARPRHVPGDARGQGAAQRHRADVLRHHAARRLAVLGRPAARAAPGAGQGRRHGVHLLHPPRGRVLPAQGPAHRRQRRPSRPTPAATSTCPRTTWRTTSAGRRSSRWRPWASRWSSATTRSRPGQQEIDLRYADALSMADNIMTLRHVVREVALAQGVHATFMPKPFTDLAGSAMHTHLSLFEGDRNAFHDAGRPDAAVDDRQAVHRRPAHPRPRVHRRHQPDGELLPAAAGRHRGADGGHLGPGQPLGAGAAAVVQAEQGATRPGSRSARRTRPATPT